MEIKIKKLNNEAKIPTRKSDKAAGYDLYACVDKPITIPAHETIKIGTGIAMSLPDGYFGAIFARSGLATKQGLRPANCVGVCDCDYTGEYIVAMHNDSNIAQLVMPGERIAQLVLMQHSIMEFVEVDELDETKRGDSGFGSTGKQ